MQNQSVAVPTSFPNFSAQLDVRTIEPSTLVGQLSASLGPKDEFAIFGSTDPGSTGTSPNLSLLANIEGDKGQTRLNTELRGWPYLFVQRLRGTNPGNFIAEGNLAQNAPVVPVSAALPLVGNFVQLSFATFAGPVRVSLDGSQTAKDVFNVYGTNDPAANSTSGAVLIGQMTGGAASLAAGSPTSVLVIGYSFVLVERLSGVTAGNAIAWGAGTPTGAGSGSSPSKFNKAMPAMNASAIVAPFDQGAGPILATPVGYVYVVVNNVLYEVGDGTTAAPCYFASPLTPLVPRAQGAIQAGDVMFWNAGVAPGAGFPLAAPPPLSPPGTADSVDYMYNA